MKGKIARSTDTRNLLQIASRSALFWAADILGVAAAFLWELSGAELPGVATSAKRLGQ